MMRPLMRQTSRTFLRAARQRGFTLIELITVLSIMAIIIAIGVPNMSEWLYKSKVASATQFYAEGMGMARDQALTHNSASRLVLTDNLNGQMNWRVDICFPRPETPCTATSTNWSSSTAVATNDPEKAAGFKSVERNATALVPSTQLAPTIEPVGARSVYFTPVGWVDTTVGTPIKKITLNPAGPHAKSVSPVAVALTLAGIASRCKPEAEDLQRCPF